MCHLSKHLLTLNSLLLLIRDIVTQNLNNVSQTVRYTDTVGRKGCPLACHCWNYTAVCQCEGGGFSTLALDTFTGIDFLNEIVVHKCNEVIVSSKAFRDVTVQSDIRFHDIGNLIINAEAFYGMRKHPKKINFANVTMKTIPRHAFMGVQNVSLIGFRETDIGVIEPQAFYGVQNTDYIYFFRSKIAKISTNAFDSLTNVRHVKFVENVMIHSIAETAFRGAKLEMIEFKDRVEIEQIQRFAFANVQNVATLRFEKSTIHRISDDLIRVVSEDNAAGIGHTIIDDCVFTNLSFALFSNSKKFEAANSELTNILAFDSDKPGKIEEMRFLGCSIPGTLATGAFSNTGCVNLRLSNTSINRVQSHAFRRLSNVASMNFEFVHFNILESRAFADISATSVTFKHCNFTVGIVPNLFTHSEFQDTIITHSNVANIHQNAFGTFRSRRVLVLSNQISYISDYAFRDLVSEEVQLADNNISYLQNMTFAAITTKTFLITRNLLMCQCSQPLESFEKLQKIYQYGGYKTLKINENSCQKQLSRPNEFETVPLTDYVTNVCEAQGNHRALRYLLHPQERFELRCENVSFFTRCQCYSAGTLTINEQFIHRGFSTETTFLELTNCDMIHIASNAFDDAPFTHLRIVSTALLRVDSNAFRNAKMLKFLSIEASRLYSLDKNAFTFLDAELYDFTIERGIIDLMPPELFANSKIENLLILGTQINRIAQNSTTNSHITNFTFTNSNISLFENGAFNGGRISQLTLKQNNISDLSPKTLPLSLLESKHIVLENNYFRCQCSASALKILTRHTDISNKLSRRNTAYNVAREVGDNNYCSLPTQSGARSIRDSINNYKSQTFHAPTDTCVLGGTGRVSYCVFLMVIELWLLLRQVLT